MANNCVDTSVNTWSVIKKQITVRVVQLAEPERLLIARSFVYAVAQSLWRESIVKQGIAWKLHDNPVATVEIDDSLNELQRLVTHSLMGSSLLEQAYAVGTLYTMMLPEAMRSKDGVFYTPVPIVEHLVAASEKAGVTWSSARVLDPACGCGVFLIAVADKMRSSLTQLTPRERIEHISTHLVGMELDPFTAWLTHVFLELSLLKDCKDADYRLPMMTIIGDTLNAETHPNFDLVIGNPPYGRVTLSKSLRLRFQRSLYGHANLYGLFTDFAVSSLKPAGVLAFVTPTSFLGGQYFKALRRLLATQIPPISIDFVNNRIGVFDDVLQETVLTVYRHSKVQPDVEVGILDCGVAGAAVRTRLGAYPVSLEGPWLFPRTSEQAALVAAVDTLPARMSDLGYEVVTGPLVWNRHKPQLRSTKLSSFSYPIIWAESVTEKGFSFSSNKRNHAPFIDIASDQAYLLTDSPCIVLQRTTSIEQHKRLICAVLPQSFVDEHGGAVVENHLNMLRPSTDKGLTPEFMAFILNSRAVDLAFRCISGSVAVSAYELEHLPFPAIAEMLYIQDVWLADKTGVDAVALLNRCYGL